MTPPEQFDVRIFASFEIFIYECKVLGHVRL